METTTKALKVDVGSCARCAQDHKSLEFVPLVVPIGEWTYWTSCPITKEPILLKVEETEETKSNT